MKVDKLGSLEKMLPSGIESNNAVRSKRLCVAHTVQLSSLSSQRRQLLLVFFLFPSCPSAAFTRINDIVSFVFPLFRIGFAASA